MLGRVVLTTVSLWAFIAVVTFPVFFQASLISRQNMKQSNLRFGLIAVLTSISQADGIPEPGIILYGQIKNGSLQEVRVTSGTLHWDIGGPAGRIRLSADAGDLAGGNSYRLRIPFESLVGGNTKGPNTFFLNPGGTALNDNKVAFEYQGTFYPANPLLGSAFGVYNLGKGERGVVIKVDVKVNPTNLVIFGSGSKPTVGQMLGTAASTATVVQPGLQFTGIQPHPDGGVEVEWTGVPPGKGHFLIRARAVDEQLGEYEVIEWFPAKVSGPTAYRDSAADPEATYFYRLLSQ
jgi:hypothetical protein